MVEQRILESPFLEDALRSGILNLSALARLLKPSVERELMKQVSASAVMMALKRIGPTIAGRMPAREAAAEQRGEISVRSDLVELTFRRSDTIWERQKRLLQRVEQAHEAFLTYTQGMHEAMFILSAALEPKVLETLRGEKLIWRQRDLSAVVMRLSPATVRTPGVYYSILKRLAWSNLNVVEVVSTYREFTIVVGSDDVDRAFSALRRYLWG